MKNIIFISKDALRCDALPVYGNTYWKTPNIDELASKGTVFQRHYTAGGSTAMAFTAMSLGKYCFETDRKLYDGNESAAQGETLFDALYDAGYDVHIAWDDSYTSFAKSHFKCEGEHTILHSLNRIIPVHSPHVAGEYDDLTYKDEDTEKAILLVENLADELAGIKDKPIFLWFHLPHVFAGRNAYDSDIDVFDRIIGIFRQRFEDESIYIGADHGQMNGHKGKFSYGYNVEEGVMRIPLITPKFMGVDSVDFVTSSIQMNQIFGLEPFHKKEYAICETAYYAQPCREVAIVHGDFKLVYSKKSKKYALYDLKWDSAEELNLYYPEFYDTDRHNWYSLNQRFYYPNWEEALKEKQLLTNEMNRIWRNGTFVEELQQKLIYRLKLLVSRLQQKKKKKSIINIGNNRKELEMVDQSSKNIKLGTIITYITQFLSIGISFVYVPIMLDILGQAEYGLYALVQSIISYLQMSEMGIGTTATRYNSKYIAEGDKEGQKTINGMFLKMYFGIAGVCVIIAVVLFCFLDDIYADYSRQSIQLIKTLFVIAVINLVITFVFQIFNAIIIAYEQYIFLKIITLIQTILGPISMLAVLYLGYRSVGMLCVTTVISLLFGLTQMFFCLKKFKIKFTFKGHNRDLFTKIFSFTIFVFINSLATQMMMNSDKVIISIVMTEYAVAVYAIVMQFHTYSYNFANVLSGFYLPRFTKVIAKQGEITDELFSALISTGRIQIFVAGLIFGGFLSVGKPFIVQWVGTEYVEAYWLTVIILLTEVIGAAQSMFNALMQAMNLHKTRAIISLIISVVKIILTVIMTIKFGLLGCAVSFFVGWTIKQIVFNVYYKRCVGIDVKAFWLEMTKMFIPLFLAIVVLSIGMWTMQILIPATNYVIILFYVCLYLLLYGGIMWSIALNSYEKAFIQDMFRKVRRKNEPNS